MNYCQCNICLIARADFITSLGPAAAWWNHRRAMEEAAQRACEAARAAGYVDPPSRFPRGVPV